MAHGFGREFSALGGEMKRVLLVMILALAGIPLSAQTGAFNGFATQGGYSAQTQGLASSNKQQVLIPSATITVYLTGTLTPATIYKDAINTPLSNPFTADSLSAVAPGKWLFFAATGQGYDVVMSGGIAPLTFTAPVTLTDLIIGAGGGGAQTIIEVNGAATSPVSPVNFVDSASVTWTRTGATISATAETSGGTIPVWPNIYYSAVAPNNSFTYASVFIGGTSYTVTIPSGCAGTYGNATTLATGSTPLVFKDITTSTTLCTLTFGSGSGTAVVTGAGGTVSSGDLLSLTVATADATLAGVTAELAGTTPGAGGGGGIGYPAGSGIPQVVSGTSWGATYNAANLIPANFLSLIPLAGGVSGLLPIANGGTGTATPSLISGVGITISGSWPNQTVTATGGGGGGMIWPAGPGIANCTGTPCTSWLTSYNSSNQIPANFVSILNQSTTGNAATATSLASAPALCTGGNVAIGILANGNATGCTPPGGAPLWSSLTNPTAALSLSMGNANTTTWTAGAATSTNNMFTWTDTASNTGTGILGRFTTAASSAAVPWQADANGVGWQVTPTGALKSVGSTVAGTIGWPQGTAPGAAPTNTIQMYAPTSVTAYNLVLPGAVASGSNTFLSCTAANPSVCTWAAGGGGGSGNYINLCTLVTLANATCSGGVISFSAAASVTISAIPGTNINLEMMIRGFVSTGDPTILFQINGDTTQGDYACGRLIAVSGSVIGQTCSGLSISGGNATAGDLGASSSDVSANEITIPFYSSAIPQAWVAKTFQVSNPLEAVYGGSNSTAAAITSIKITANGAGNMTGTLTLYGTN